MATWGFIMQNAHFSSSILIILLRFCFHIWKPFALENPEIKLAKLAYNKLTVK